MTKAYSLRSTSIPAFSEMWGRCSTWLRRPSGSKTGVVCFGTASFGFSSLPSVALSKEGFFFLNMLNAMVFPLFRKCGLDHFNGFFRHHQRMYGQNVQGIQVFCLHRANAAKIIRAPDDIALHAWQHEHCFCRLLLKRKVL